MFSFSQERERMSKEQYRAAQKLFLLEKLNLEPNSEEKFTSIYFETQEKIYNKMMSYRKIKREEKKCLLNTAQKKNTSTEVACEWAGSVINRLFQAFGQEH